MLGVSLLSDLLQRRGEGGEGKAEIRGEQSLLCSGQAWGSPHVQGGRPGVEAMAGRVVKATARGRLSPPFRPGFPHLPLGEQSVLADTKPNSHHSFYNVRPSPHARDKATILEGCTPTLPPPQSCLLEQRGPSPHAQKNLGLHLIQGSNKWPFCSLHRVLSSVAERSCSDRGRLHRDIARVSLPILLAKAPDGASGSEAGVPAPQLRKSVAQTQPERLTAKHRGHQDRRLTIW